MGKTELSVSRACVKPLGACLFRDENGARAEKRGNCLPGAGRSFTKAVRIANYLGALPLTMQIRQQADSGQPTVAADPDGEIAQIYKSVARQVAIKAGPFHQAMGMVSLSASLMR